MELPELLTTAEVAEAARLSPKTIYNRVYRGLPPQPVRVSGRLRFNAEDVRRWLREGEASDDARE